MRSRRRTRRFPWATLAALALAAAGGCTPADNGEFAATDPSSPLEPYLAVVWSGGQSEEEKLAWYAEQARRTEELIVECMAAQGWAYTPNDTDQIAVSLGTDDDWRPDDRDWVATWGYGAIDSPWLARDEEFDLAGEDPNWAYVQSLPPADQEAFWAALWGGPQAAELDEDGSEIWDWENAGCAGWAQNQVQPSESLWELAEFRPLYEALEAMWHDFNFSPEVAAINQAWAQCMAEGGHPDFSEQWDAANSIFEALNDIWDGFDWESWDWATNGDPENAPEIAAAREQLRQQELELALLDLDCREQTGYRERMADAQLAAEEHFVAEHREALEALRAAGEARNS